MIDRRQASSQRRQGERTPFVASVRQAAAGSVRLALAQDLGASGIKLRRAEGPPLPPATPVYLTFELPDGQGLLELDGEVVYERLDGNRQFQGIRFSPPPGASHARLTRYVASYSRS